MIWLTKSVRVFKKPKIHIETNISQRRGGNFTDIKKEYVVITNIEIKPFRFCKSFFVNYYDIR